MTAAPVVRSRSRHALWMALAALVVVLLGFFTTFIQPVARGTFVAPPIVHAHGALLFLWTIGLVVQSTLVQTGRTRLHRRLGLAVVLLVPLIVVSTVATGAYVLRRDVAAGGGQVAISSIVGIFTTPLIFTALVIAALAYRRRPEYHKRLMLLAMFAIMWPAFFRFRHYFAPVARPDVIFGAILPSLAIVALIYWDRVAHGRWHVVYRTVGVALAVEGLVEVAVFDSGPWRVLAQWLSGFFL